MRDFTTDIAEVARRVSEAEAYLKVPEMRTRLSELEVEIAKPDLWNDQENAKRVNSEYASVKGDLDEFDRIARTLDDVQVLHEMAREVDDASQEPEIEQSLSRARAALDEVELRSLFIGEHDEADAIVQINAKDGGIDAQDWSAMLLRMFTRWAERRNFSVRGRYAYGLLTSERGTHRLVRISPFDNQGRRQTSFATVQVWPVLEEVDVEINDADIDMEVYRASGAGGQHVNKTSSAVRLIHRPTGLVAASQQERSQLQNRENAYKKLKTMVATRIEEEREAELARIAGKQATVGWGTQIRSYVLQPYQMVKDLRTDVESGNVTAVLDGDLDEFMEGYLRWRRTEAGK
jgi:peptide chain release factor 2